MYLNNIKFVIKILSPSIIVSSTLNIYNTKYATKYNTKYNTNNINYKNFIYCYSCV
jgi:hypothetical protein